MKKEASITIVAQSWNVYLDALHQMSRERRLVLGLSYKGQWRRYATRLLLVLSPIYEGGGVKSIGRRRVGTAASDRSINGVIHSQVLCERLLRGISTE
ncbi:hypothetical protein J6590_079077 [Homalodisca vitripennis]|nr:hypothetical protein J6590_079077 [Homalodisca vitripennis]